MNTADVTKQAIEDGLKVVVNHKNKTVCIARIHEDAMNLANHEMNASPFYESSDYAEYTIVTGHDIKYVTNEKTGLHKLVRITD